MSTKHFHATPPEVEQARPSVKVKGGTLLFAEGLGNTQIADKLFTNRPK